MSELKEEGLYLSWWQMSIIKVAGMVCLPVLIVGAEIGKKYGLLQAALAIFLGNLCLFLLGLAKCSMSFKNKNNTMENASNYFGQSGTKIFSLNIIVSLIGWFAIQLSVIGLSLERAIAILSNNSFSIPTIYYNIFLGFCITSVALFGLKGLNRLATLCAPLLIFTVAYGLFAVSNQGSPVTLPPFQYSFLGVSLVMATAITAIIDLPTYYRYSRSLKDGQISLFISFIIALPILEFAGAYIATKIPGNNFVDVLSGIGGAYWQLWIAFFLIFAGWTTNNTNLYSASVALEQLCWKKNEIARSFLVGILGTALSCFNLINSFAPILNAMGILVSSMGAVIICNYAYNQIFKKNVSEYGSIHYLLNIFSWAIGTIFGFCNMFKIFSLTGIELIDAFLSGGLCTLILLANKSAIEKVIENSQFLQRTMKGKKI